MRFPVALRQSETKARINGTEITVTPGETLLQAALRQGIAFPNSCRVGGCGACKCRVTTGAVQEMTETGYLLSAEEISGGVVLACQSRPRHHVEIEVTLETETTCVVVAQERLTHDITRLVLQPDTALSYLPGQFVNVTLGHVTRTYSFATPPQADETVTFFIRHVPGGAFSSAVHHGDLVGSEMTLGRPTGEFWLRPQEGPLLFVAGGSGLAPILAMLRDAVARGETTRPATLLFGARTRQDLYLQDELKRLAAQWEAGLRIVPVLASEPVSNDNESDDQIDNDAWHGARGLVTEHIQAPLDQDTRAYLCGPPGMVDAAQARLLDDGLPPQSIYFDRFTTAAETADAKTSAPQARFRDYAKYGLFHLVGLFAALMLLAGSHFITLGTAVVVLGYLVSDAWGGDDTSTPHYQLPGVLTVLLWGALPLVTFICFVSIWTVSPSDLLGLGAFVTEFTGIDVLASKAATTTGQHVAGFVLTGLMIGLVGTIPAHELTHRPWDKVSLTIGRWLLAFSFDTVFSIEHVYGHHRYVSTTHDPATAPRGRHVYTHIIRSTLDGNLSAWRIETERLRKKSLPIYSRHNLVLTGHSMSLGLVILVWWAAGGAAAAYFVLCALWGKALLEIVNYMEHYGLVRSPDDPVRPHHSWNTNRRFSSWTMFNLTRHSHHHAQGEVPYHALKPYAEAPMMVGGYLTTIIVTLIPPLWHHMMTPKLLEWDRLYASQKERRLADQANAASGIPVLMHHSRNRKDIDTAMTTVHTPNQVTNSTVGS